MGLLSLIARLTLNASGFEQTLKRTQSQTKAWGKELGGSVKGSLIAAFGPAALGAAAGAAGKSIVNYGGKISDLSVKAKTSARNLQELEYAFGQNGASIEDVSSAYTKLRKAREAALGGNTETMDVFKAMGVSEEQLRNNPIDKTFDQIAEKIHNTDFGDDEEPLLQKLMGKGAGNLIAGMKAGIADLRAEFRELGMGIDDNVIAALDKAGDKWDQMGLRMRSGLAPAVAWLADSISWLFGKLEQGGRMLGALSNVIAPAKGTTRNQALQQLSKETSKFYGISGEATGALKSKAELEAERKNKASFNPEQAKKDTDASIKVAEKQLELQKQLVELRSKGELEGLTTEEKRLKLMERSAAKEREINNLKNQYGPQVGGNLALLQAQIEKEKIDNDLKSMEDKGDKASEMQVDPLAKIGALSINADAGSHVRTWQDRMLRSSEEVAQNTRWTGGGLP